MELTKYTIYCRNGYLFKTDTHFLCIGEWLPMSCGYTILHHGTMTEEEARQIRSQSLVNLYQDMRNKTISIFPQYHDKYLSRKEDKSLLISYVGCLKRTSLGEYKGYVHIK